MDGRGQKVPKKKLRRRQCRLTGPVSCYGSRWSSNLMMMVMMIEGKRRVARLGGSSHIPHHTTPFLLVGASRGTSSVEPRDVLSSFHRPPVPLFPQFEPIAHRINPPTSPRGETLTQQQTFSFPSSPSFYSIYFSPTSSVFSRKQQRIFHVLAWRRTRWYGRHGNSMGVLVKVVRCQWCVRALLFRY